MKAFKKLIPAIAMLLVSAVLLGTSTFAWFSINNKVTVTGMTINTKVGTNLLISGGTNTSDAEYSIGLNQSVTGLLEPVSTINGISYFYTPSSNVAGDGSAIDATNYVAYAAGDTFDANYGYNPTGGDVADCLGYVDYAFYLKATTTAADQKVAMTRCNLTYQGGSIGSDKAWRVAVFAVETATATTVDNATVVTEGNLVTILKPDTAAYFGGTAVSAVNAKAAVNAKIDDAANVATIATVATKYYKVVVRLWLEGEDTTCKNETFASLTKDYRLDLEFVVQAGDGVTLIGSVGSAVATSSTTTGTVTLSNTTTGNIANGEEAASFQWVNASTGANIGSATTYQYVNDSGVAVDVYCLVTTTRGNIYRTNTVSLTAS